MSIGFCFMFVLCLFWVFVFLFVFEFVLNLSLFVVWCLNFGFWVGLLFRVWNLGFWF